MAVGKAGTSSTGAAMSKYDVEVEARLQALEKAVEECKECCQKGGGDDGDVGARLDALIEKLGRHMSL